jgi:hypothetical protein
VATTPEDSVGIVASQDEAGGTEDEAGGTEDEAGGTEDAGGEEATAWL